MPPLVAREIVLLPDGAEGLKVTGEGRDFLLPLKRGDHVSFRASGLVGARRRKDLCTLCDGTRCLKGVPDCLFTHIVYLALFGRIIKVGVTRQGRFETRMREQGAQYAMELEAFPDGMKARRREKGLAAERGVRLGIRFDEKVKAIGAVKGLDQAKEVMLKAGFKEAVKLKDLRHLYQFPSLDSLARPIILQGDDVRGRVEDTRGEVLLLSHRNNLYAYDLRRTLGRVILLKHVKTKSQLTLDNFDGDISS